MIKGILCCFGSTLINCAVDICNKVLAKNKIPITTQLLYLGFFTLRSCSKLCSKGKKIKKNVSDEKNDKAKDEKGEKVD